jgi:hypothetical protein
MVHRISDNTIVLYTGIMVRRQCSVTVDVNVMFGMLPSLRCGYGRDCNVWFAVTIALWFWVLIVVFGFAAKIAL